MKHFVKVIWQIQKKNNNNVRSKLCCFFVLSCMFYLPWWQKDCFVGYFLHIYIASWVHKELISSFLQWNNLSTAFDASGVIYLMMCSLVCVLTTEQERSQFVISITTSLYRWERHFHQYVKFTDLVYYWSTAINLVIISGLNRSFWSCKSNNYLYPCSGPIWNMLHVKKKIVMS